MTSPLELQLRTARPNPRLSVGDRVRQLRINSGLTQTDLAGERFSKEYVSQIERGKTRPTRETVAWLAERLGVDENYLLHGVSSSERDRIESVVARAEAALEAHEYGDVPTILASVPASLAGVQAPELELRTLRTEAWARMYLGEVRESIRLLERDVDQPAHAGARARRLVEPPVRPAPLAHPRVALALLPAPARLGGGARGRRARARAREGRRRSLRARAGLLPGVARRGAPGPLGARALARGAREDALRGDRARGERR